MTLVKSSLVSGVLFGTLVGCQTVYPTHFVPFSPLTVEYKNDSYDFKVVDLTPTAALEANKVWKYTPRNAPAGLQSSALESQNYTVRATSLGESEDEYLFAQVAESVSTVQSPEDLRNPPPSPAQPYSVGVGDVFTVTIEGIGNDGGASVYQRTTTVDYAGNIFLPDVGEVNVVGRTVAEARQIVADRFRDARLSGNASATVTEFNSQKVLVSVPGRPTSFLPVTNTPITLRDAYLRNSSGIDRDAQRQIVVLRRDGQNYSTRGRNVLRQTYGYDVFLRDGDEIQIFDRLLEGYDTASVSGDVLALRSAEFEQREAERQEERFRIQQEQFETAEQRAVLQDQRAAEAAEIARENARIARQNAELAEQRLDLARLDTQLAQSAESRAQAAEARAERDEARLEAAEARAREAEARAAAAEARHDAREAREAAAEARAQRQLALEELSNRRADRQLALDVQNGARSDRSAAIAERNAIIAEQNAALAGQNAARDLARSRFDLGLETQDRIFVGGEVGQQQAMTMPFGRHLTLAEAIYGSNGVEPITGDPSRIYVVRVKSSVAGSVESFIFHFDGGNLANTPAMTMFEMRPDDYVLIMPRRVSNWSRFITQLVPTLNTALSAARATSL